MNKKILKISIFLYLLSAKWQRFYLFKHVFIPHNKNLGPLLPLLVTI